LSLYKNLFKQTAIYGLATVLPRMLSFLLVMVHTKKLVKADYGETTILLAYMVFLNVILSYGMETAFFRFYNSEENKKNVMETSMISIFWTSISFLFISLFFRNTISGWIGVEVEFVTYAIWILVLDALVIIPFSKLRAQQRPIVYAVIKIGNVVVNMALNLFFLLYLPEIAQKHPDTFLATIYFEDFQVGYISGTITGLPACKMAF
jgi:O-antigen/teichoic acid export membrane protein